MARQKRPCPPFLWLLLSLLNSLSVQYVFSSCPAVESQALLALKGEDTLNAHASWKEGSDCCDGWAGVTCDPFANHVIALNLTGNLQLHGGLLSSSFCDLHRLQVADISISPSSLGAPGEIPDCLWTMTDVKYLAIGRAYLGGNFSASVCNLKNLTHLDMHGTLLDGDIPDCIWNMTKLEYLDLRYLNLHGSVSPQLCNLQNLSRLALTGNILGGALPACIWNMTRLEYMNLGGLYLPGSLSSDLCNLGHLTHLELQLNNLDGYIPTCVWEMTTLEYLDLGFLSLPGSFSSDMCNLQKLTYLNISQNDFTGVLPACLWSMASLETLDMSSLTSWTTETSWTMEAPGEMVASPLQVLKLSHISDSQFHFAYLTVNFSSLRILDLSANSMTLVPGWTYNLPSLEIFYAGDNLLLTVPPWIARAEALWYLDLQNNEIGTLGKLPPTLQFLSVAYNAITKIPESIAALGSSLETLHLSHNYIKSVPSNLFNLSKLKNLDLANNLITDLPPAPFNLSMLSSLNLSGNDISGDFSLLLMGLPAVSSLDVSNNRLSGELPGSLYTRAVGRSSMFLNVAANRLGGRVSEFRWGGVDGILDLSSNNFQGEPPPLRMSGFSILSLSKNNFTGFIPAGLEYSPGLQVLDLSFNRFSGAIPAFLGGLTKLQALDLSSNQLNGTLPADIGNCHNLQRLSVGNNSLIGQIPDSLGTIGTKLLSLSLRHNYFEGKIPAGLGNCTGLRVLDLSHNDLNGTLPSTIKDLNYSLRVLTVASNRLGGPFPSFIVDSDFKYLQVLDLSNNSFHGHLPLEYSGLQAFVMGSDVESNENLYLDGIQAFAKGQELEVTYFVTVRPCLDVSLNQFSGGIPEKLGVLLSLRSLTLSDNTFSGRIPTNLSNLYKLESMDLSDNHLSGGIPPEFRDIPQLTHFNVSNNFLSGPIPEGGSFVAFNETSFSNNTDLCGFPLSVCHSASPERSLSRRQKLSDWVSWTAVALGFVASYMTVMAIFVVSKQARSLLCVPRRKWRRVYDISKPYGAYVPRM